MYGSLTKGYGTPDSDIDGVIFLDSELEYEHHGRDSFPFFQFYEQLQEKLSLNKDKINIDFFWLSKRRIKEDIKNHDINQYKRIFYLSIGGRKINEYRKLFLDELEVLGKQGESLWRRLCLELCQWEWGTYDKKTAEKRKNLYPWTIAEAKKYFLREN